jgi:Arc/MetJ-type ribon-helix-helix transcriptional regulator
MISAPLSAGVQYQQSIAVSITLNQQQERLVSQAVETGAYRNPHNVLDRALEVLRSEDDGLQENKTAINAKIERGIAQLDRGEGIPEEALRQRLEKRKAAWIADHQG